MKKKLLLGTAVASLTIAPALPLLTSCGDGNLSEVHIININDFHGAAPGFGDPEFPLTNAANAGAIRLSQRFEEIKEKHPGSIILSGGDFNAGEGYSTCKHAETLYPVVSAMGIAYSAVGNHAWEWGSEPLENWHYDHLARTKDTQGNYFITSNVLNGNNYREKTWVIDPSSYLFKQDYNLWQRQRVKWADPFKLVDLNGHKVCLIGLTTKDTLSDGNIESMKTLSFIDYNASVVYSKMACYEAIGEEAFNKIDAFILETHLQCEEIDKKSPHTGVKGEAATLAKELTTRVDGIFAAHSHKVCSGIITNDKFKNQIPVAQAGQAGRAYTDATLIFDDSQPKGKRLKSLTMKVETVPIAGSTSTPVDKAKGWAQIQEIVKTTKYPVVKLVAQVYEQQKAIAAADLNTKIGTVVPKTFTQYGYNPTTKEPVETPTKTSNGVPYWYMDNDMKAGTEFRQSKTLLEPAGVWADIAMIQAFNAHYKEKYIDPGITYPACVAFTNIDSLKSGFTYTDTTTKDLLRKDVYQMHSFENAIHYGCLTVFQLKQYINYILDGGAGRFSYSNKTKYAPTLYNAPGELIEWDATETCNDDEKEHPLGTSYVAGPVQYHGLSFKVKKVATEGASFEKGYIYQLDEDDPNYPLRIYNASDANQSLYDPSTWTKASEWTAFNGYVPIIVASFAWQGGNKQNRMLHHWFDYNAKAKGAIVGHQIFDLYTRNSALEYIDYLKEKGWAVNQIGVDGSSNPIYIDEDYIDKLLTMPKP